MYDLPERQFCAFSAHLRMYKHSSQETLLPLCVTQIALILQKLPHWNMLQLLLNDPNQRWSGILLSSHWQARGR